ncbi:MAG TPA: type VII secretion protein EccB [Mycobacterium sp.]|uniref:type VII secretion protein EccB n=1 Tax=Mycolicibacterium sp. TaxID=2320850 RepID=UPI0025D897D8|nr:type VII secretion protein EccB [Mycolicibacterium sp.]HPX37105.1 type VII secretion protein EccB [Mycobacterium sp.]HQC77530.1 type VII secretion protein EccB [Mycobacterium sp.]
MPLNLSNREQNSGHLFYNRRLRAAITRFSVRMKHDDRKQQAALALSVVFVVLACGWMALLGVMKPAGLTGSSPIVGNRDTGALYAKVDGRLHPALNLTSARLVTGSAAAPAWVKAGEIAKYPTGPLIGIPGIPDDVTVSGDPVSAWAVCDTAAKTGTGGGPTVTAIAGRLAPAGRAEPMRADQAVLAAHRGATYLIWNGKRSRIDTFDRSVTLNLGLDPATTRPVEISTALFDAMPAAEPLVIPPVPEAGSPSRWLAGSVVGRVLQTRDAAGSVSGLYVLLPNGIQKITPFVAELLRTADSHGSAVPQLIAPDALVRIPAVDVLRVDFYPTGKLSFVDTAASPVTCVSWTKGGGDPQAAVVLFTGRGLPTPADLDGHIVDLVRDSRGPDSVEAQQTLVLPGAANFVASTGGGVIADSRESLFWVSPQGVRYGIERDPATLTALAIDPDRAVQAPWPILRTFAAGPAINRADALLARDSIAPAGPGQILPGSERGEG